MRTDASAAVGILSRQGTGRIKHLQIRQMWLQEKVKDQDLKLIKIPRSINVADLLTHHWNEKDGLVHMSGMHIVRRGPRNCGAPEGGSQRIMHFSCQYPVFNVCNNSCGSKEINFFCRRDCRSGDWRSQPIIKNTLARSRVTQMNDRDLP